MVINTKDDVVSLTNRNEIRVISFDICEDLMKFEEKTRKRIDSSIIKDIGIILYVSICEFHNYSVLV